MDRLNAFDRLELDDYESFDDEIDVNWLISSDEEIMPAYQCTNPASVILECFSCIASKVGSCCQLYSEPRREFLQRITNRRVGDWEELF